MNLHNIADGGLIGYLIILIGAIAIGVFIERLLALKKEKKELIDLDKAIIEKLKTKDIKGALEEAQNAKGVAGKIFYDILNKNTDKKQVLKLTLEESAATEVPHLWKNLNLLSLIITVSPLLGLLGTVLGMLQSFQEIESLASAATGAYGPGVVAGGIKKALVTTILGLMVAIPINVCYTYLMSIVEKITLEMEKISYDIIDYIADSKENSK